MPQSKIYSFEEVANHNSHKDCWLVISGKVYDITPFMGDHPGGDDVMVSSTGKDATDDFEDVGHSKTARDIMSKYYIGDFDSSTAPNKSSFVSTTTAPINEEGKGSDSITKLLLFLVPLIILGLAYLVRIYTKVE
ncbi:Cytochrome b5 [Apostasia shenzhenica]|uniref:Cytochrome b5 n=1 Tax=Apostasia shenzhenica TaxID=1088818 RepID=A0A2I0BEX6_9ASPA|nr:Cytochrome b5 [Apostasia shenzhenica]